MGPPFPTRAPLDEVKDFGCPKCGAKTGELCTARTYRDQTRAVRPHKERIDAYLKSQDTRE